LVRLLPLRGNKVVGASHGPNLEVFDLSNSFSVGRTEEGIQARQLEAHKQSITCLVELAAAHFASACSAGVVTLWSSRSLSMYQRFELHPSGDTSRDAHDLSQPYEVTAIAPLGKNWMAVAMGRALHIFQISSGQLLSSLNQAHDAPIHHLLPLAEGRLLVTAGEDKVIYLWSLAHLFQRDLLSDDPVLHAQHLLRSPFMALQPSHGSDSGSGGATTTARPASLAPGSPTTPKRGTSFRYRAWQP
jgi:WD40 repeat protein